MQHSSAVTHNNGPQKSFTPIRALKYHSWIIVLVRNKSECREAMNPIPQLLGILIPVNLMVYTQVAFPPLYCLGCSKDL